MTWMGQFHAARLHFSPFTNRRLQRFAIAETMRDTDVSSYSNLIYQLHI